MIPQCYMFYVCMYMVSSGIVICITVVHHASRFVIQTKKDVTAAAVHSVYCARLAFVNL